MTTGNEYLYTAPDGTKYSIAWSSSRTRHEIYFAGKPGAEVRDNMKSHGARWNRFDKCWTLSGFTYAGDDIPLIVSGDSSAGCHAESADFDEMVYQSGYGC